MPIGLKGNTDGSGAVQIGGSDAITISTGLNTTFAGTVTASGGVLYPLTSGTAIASTSGTALDFTGIPSWVKRITVMLSGVSTSGTSNFLVQLGDSGGVENTGYEGFVKFLAGASLSSSSQITNGIGLSLTPSASHTYSGHLILTLISGSSWVATSYLGASNDDRSYLSSSIKTLSDTLTQVRITTVNGTDTFDAGSINILFE
jgi:hypothetical protein